MDRGGFYFKRNLSASFFSRLFSFGGRFSFFRGRFSFNYFFLLGAAFLLTTFLFLVAMLLTSFLVR